MTIPTHTAEHDFGGPRRDALPLILVRGFGGLGVEDEKRVGYQGFNDGTVYPHKRGENYIYEGFILRFMKSRWRYRDATNVVGYYSVPVADAPELPPELAGLPGQFFAGDRIVIDPAMARDLVRPGVAGEPPVDPRTTLWVFRYYDLDERSFKLYGEALKRLIEFIRALTRQTQDAPPPMVNIIAHSMGGLIVREAIQRAFAPGEAKAAINKVVTLGTPHQGITFQLFRDLSGLNVDAGDEIAQFNPEWQSDPKNDASFHRLAERFPLERLLTVIGTNYRTFGTWPATALNRLFSVPGEYGPNYNRSDGLVKQSYAQIPGAPRTFVHKCHGGYDSLITSRETFEIATRFFFGDVYARLTLRHGRVTKGFDFLSKSEFFLGVSVKPRGVDFDLFHQSKEAENTYGPFRSADFTDEEPAFGWAGREDRLIWEGWLDTNARRAETDLVIRFEVYVGERDLFGVGFSDTVVFHRHYFVRAILEPELTLHLYTSETFQNADDPFADSRPLARDANGAWQVPVSGEGFEAEFGLSLAAVPEVGSPTPI